MGTVRQIPVGYQTYYVPVGTHKQCYQNIIKNWIRNGVSLKSWIWIQIRTFSLITDSNNCQGVTRQEDRSSSNSCSHRLRMRITRDQAKKTKPNPSTSSPQRINAKRAGASPLGLVIVGRNTPLFFQTRHVRCRFRTYLLSLL